MTSQKDAFETIVGKGIKDNFSYNIFTLVMADHIIGKKLQKFCCLQILSIWEVSNFAAFFVTLYDTIPTVNDSEK